VSLRRICLLTLVFVVHLIAILGIILLNYDSWLPLYYVSGGICNTLLSKVLKDTIRQPRPKLSKKPGFGMPSSHAQSLFYFVSISSLCLTRYNTDHYVLNSMIVVGLITYASFGT
jgi:membrane-associated phospholipid phosphatase